MPYMLHKSDDFLRHFDCVRMPPNNAMHSLAQPSTLTHLHDLLCAQCGYGIVHNTTLKIKIKRYANAFTLYDRVWKWIFLKIHIYWKRFGATASVFWIPNAFWPIWSQPFWPLRGWHWINRSLKINFQFNSFQFNRKPDSVCRSYLEERNDRNRTLIE